MRHFALEALQGRGLPAGAVVYQWPAFTHFYSGNDAVLRLSDMGGVVAFPSFHTVLALLVTQALAGTRWRVPAMFWTAGIILSAIPMGGHYVVDLAAGFVIWLAAASIARRVTAQ
jgi:membrane-associated phospholipid phosphatase